MRCLKTLDFDRLARRGKFPGERSQELARRLLARRRFTGQVAVRRADLRHAQGTLGRAPRPRQHGHRIPGGEGKFSRAALRSRRGSRRPLHHPSDDRSRSFDRANSRPSPIIKDNVHWFTAEDETGFLFNVHVVETNPENPKPPGRVYVDPMGEKLSGGLIKAPKISYGKVNQLYG